MSLERRHLHYRGRVQGVGFRYTAHRLAQGREITGFVRNLEDGRVELLAEGEPGEVGGFLKAIAGALGGKVHDVQAVREEIAARDYPDFSILY